MNKLLCALLALAGFSAGCQSYHISYREGVVPQPAEVYSPLIGELLAQLGALEKPEGDQLVETWRGWLGDRPIPVIEGSLMTFIYWEKESAPPEKVILSANFNEWNEEDTLYRAGQSSFFYKSYKIDNPSDIRYFYITWKNKEEKRVLDPHNPAVDLSVKPPHNRILEEGDPNGHLELIPKVTARPGSKTPARDLTVYLPPGYSDHPAKRYPVLYMHDGQNIWDGERLPFGGWKMDSTATALIKKGQIEPLIIVGIANSGLRKEEYVGASAHFGYETASTEKFAAGTRRIGEDYRDYLVETVKPLIDARYRTLTDRGNTGLAGSSFGAGASYWIGFSRPEVFSKIAGLSAGNYTPGVSGWEEKPFNMMPYLAQKVIHKNRDFRLYLDCGTINLDQTFLPQARILREGLNGLGFVEGQDLVFAVSEGADHNEKAWAARAADFLIHLFPPRTP